MIEINLVPGKKAYFASDTHLGLPPIHSSKERERLFVSWLDQIKSDAQVLFLLGDIFDFWYEYRKVIPKGFTRFLGKLCELSDNGIKIYFFTGNHDVWLFDYLPDEVGLNVIKHHETALINNQNFYLAHGDDLNPKDYGFRILKYCFANRYLQFLFSRIHPNLAFTFGHWWSKHSRYSKGITENFLGEDKEHQIVFAKKMLLKKHFQYFVFGHRHLPMDFKLNESSRLINLGEWIHACTYGEFDGVQFFLKKIKSDSRNH